MVGNGGCRPNSSELVARPYWSFSSYSPPLAPRHGKCAPEVRAGLGWQFDHVIGYFGFAVLFSLAWRRPLAVGGILMVSAVLLESLQALTPDRCCDVQAAFYGVGGALAGAVFAELCGRVLRRLDRRAVLLSVRHRWHWPSRKLVSPRTA